MCNGANLAYEKKAFTVVNGFAGIDHLPQVDLMRQVREVLDRHADQAGIVYCLRRKDVDSVAAALASAGYSVAKYHAGMTSDDRRDAQEAFTAEKIDIVVATVAFGMGIDRSNVRCVIHVAMPKSIEHYQQETGRAGRDGLPSECVLLYSGGDAISLKQIVIKSAEEAGANPEYTATTIAQIDAMARYARGAVCRHAALVRHFGQKYEVPNCGACDQCLGDTDDVPDADTIAKKILSCVARVNESFGVNYVIDVLRGSAAQQLLARRHDKLSTYGLLKEVAKNDLRDWVYQLIDQEALVQGGGGEFPVLKLNAASWEVMRGERKVRLVRLAQAEPEAAPRERAAFPADMDAGLFEQLRALRRQEAVRLGVPPYVVFPDNVLVEFARQRPSTPAKMRSISGVGDKRLAEFGERFLASIAEYCEAQQLPRDTGTIQALAPRVESAKLSPNKAAAFARFREGATVSELMHELKLTRGTVADYLAEFVRVEKPASIFGWVGEEICERVAAAAAEHGHARLKPIYLALNSEVEYDDIRVVLGFLAYQPGA